MGGLRLPAAARTVPRARPRPAVGGVRRRLDDAPLRLPLVRRAVADAAAHRCGPPVRRRARPAAGVRGDAVGGHARQRDDPHRRLLRRWHPAPGSVGRAGADEGRTVDRAPLARDRLRGTVSGRVRHRRRRGRLVAAGARAVGRLVPVRILDAHRGEPAADARLLASPACARDRARAPRPPPRLAVARPVRLRARATPALRLAAPRLVRDRRGRPSTGRTR